VIPFVLEVVDGERCLGVENGQDCGGSVCRWNHLPGPSSVWNGHVLTCQTCDGTGCDIDFCQQCGDEYTDPCQRHAQHVNWTDDDNCCLDCVNGHPIIEVPVPCGCECHTSSDPDVRADAYLCDECDQLNPGTRSVRVSVQAVPIEHNAASQRTQPHVAVSTVYEPNGEAFLWVDADKQVVEVDIGPEPLSQVGRFAIIATPEGEKP